MGYYRVVLSKDGKTAIQFKTRKDNFEVYEVGHPITAEGPDCVIIGLGGPANTLDESFERVGVVIKEGVVFGLVYLAAWGNHSDFSMSYFVAKEYGVKAYVWGESL